MPGLVWLFALVLVPQKDEAAAPSTAVLQVVTVPCGSDLRRVVEGAPDHTTLQLDACKYTVGALVRHDDYRKVDYNAGIWIDRKTDLTITGAGMGLTTVTFDSAVAIGFEIRSNVDSLTIAKMTISGRYTSPNPDYGSETSAHAPTYGIGSNSGGMAVRHVNLVGLELKNLAVGLSIGSGPNDHTCVAGSHRFFRVARNYIHDIHGTGTGTGYGIHQFCADEVLISENQIWRTERHAIYHSRTSGTGSANNVITRNVIIEHRRGLSVGSNPPSALVVARSVGVAVIDNVLIGTHAYGIEVGDEPPPVSPTTRVNSVYVIGNRFWKDSMESPGTDLWLHPLSGAVYVWGNTFNRTDATESARMVASGRPYIVPDRAP